MNWSLVGKVLVALIAVGIIGGGSYYLGTRSSVQPSPTPTVSDTADEEQSADEMSVSPTETEEETGTIKGVLGFPSEGIPQLTVYAINTQSGGENFYVKTAQNQGSFTIEGVEPGTYHVVAYAEDSNLAGAWSKMVPCGLSVDCKDHSLINVEVKADEITGGVEVRDWYAPEGTFPPRPQ